MNRQERRNDVFAMLFVATAGTGTINELIKDVITGKRKNGKRGGLKQNTTVYTQYL